MDLLLQYSDMIKNDSLLTLESFQCSHIAFVCHDHEDWRKKLANSIITNIFFNNERGFLFQVRQTTKDKCTAVKVNIFDKVFSGYYNIMCPPQIFMIIIFVYFINGGILYLG